MEIITIILLLIGSLLGVSRGIAQVHQNISGIRNYKVLAFLFLIFRFFISWFGFFIGLINFITDRKDNIFLKTNFKWN